MGALDALLADLGDAWAAATDHPFIRACMDGSIKPEQFNTWLVQDYLYVRGFVGFAGATLAAAPDADLEVLLDGIEALRGELAWFRDKAQQRGLVLDTEPQPACLAYRALLSELHAAPYAVQAVALWAIELCYHQAWGRVLNGGAAEACKEFAARWGSPEFGRYVQQLAAQAEVALAQAPQHTQAARAVVAKVEELEVGFWGMAYES